LHDPSIVQLGYLTERRLTDIPKMGPATRSPGLLSEAVQLELVKCLWLQNVSNGRQPANDVNEKSLKGTANNNLYEEFMGV